jgi:hypothetical protein
MILMLHLERTNPKARDLIPNPDHETPNFQKY